MSRASIAALLLGIALALCPRAHGQSAAPTEDADTEAARRHFLSGRGFYDAGRYEEACAEFTIARRILKVAALDFNLAKCEERLEHWARAIDFYQLYLDEAGASDDKTAVIERMRQLRERLPAPTAATSESVDTRPTPLRIAAITMAAGTVALVGAGFGGYYSAWSEYQRDQGSCVPGASCAAREHVERAEHIGYALWGIAGAAAITDVVLWAIDARRRHRPSAATAGVRF